MPAAKGGQGGAGAGGGGDASVAEEPVQVRGVEEQVMFNAKRTREMFAANYGARIGDVDEAKKLRNKIKVEAEYSVVKDLPPPTQPAAAKAGAAAAAGGEGDEAEAKLHLKSQAMEKAGGAFDDSKAPQQGGAMALQVFKKPKAAGPGNQLAVRNRGPVMPRPEWHAPWKLMRVISGHLGWVRCVAVDPTNEWFATGAGDRTVKLWDLASGELKITLTGHISPVRGIAVSDRHPYMFTVGEDKLVKCWDLETNMVIRHYHGHLSGVYCCALHPTLDILCTGGRDSSVRVWDMRSKNQIFCLAGHKDTVGTLACQATDPQIISGSQDSTVRLWDLAAGKAYCTLTHHKKSVRSVCTHPTKYLFASASSDNIKQWQCPDGVFMKNVETQKAIVNCVTVNRDDVLVAGYDNGSMQWFDWRTGYNFQTEQTRVQPGSLESEAGIYAMTYDMTGTRLITCEADKTIKVYKEDETATPETHPVEWQASAPGQEKRW